jgi:tRNA(Ile2) C34 agmatinyltransferase TiaS
MRFYVGFDDTDIVGADRGTGKLARWFEEVLPDGCRPWGVIRHQLLVHPSIPYTSHNSSACVVVDAPDRSFREILIEAAKGHLRRHFLEGSDPGLCVASEEDDLEGLVAHGLTCTRRVVVAEEAYAAARACHLSGHGGTKGGIIGAAAAVGLTAWGWSGRFIGYGRLRELGDEVTVAELAAEEVQVVSVDRDGQVPAPDDSVLTGGWIRPRLWAGCPVLPLRPLGPGLWQTLDQKERKAQKGPVEAPSPI